MDRDDVRALCPFPIWSIYITTIPTNPTDTRPGTYRMPFGKGRTIVCIDDEETAQNLQRIKTPEWTWWTKAHQHGITQWSVGAPCESWSMTWDTTNITQASYTFQPSIACYVWKRVRNKGEVTSYNPFNITWLSSEELYGKNVIIDPSTWEARLPDPYNADPII